MSRTLRFQLLAVALVTLAAVAVLMRFPIVRGIDLAGGAELRYKVLFPPGSAGDPSQATRDTADILRRRLTGNALREPKIHAEGRDGILIQLPGVDGDGLQDRKRLIAPMGKLQFFAAAAPELQERFERDQVVPAGFQAVDRLLIEERAVIDGRHILHASPQQEIVAGEPRWVTAFELDAEGAKRFDEAAERLYRQQPRGRLVIVLDGKVRSAPAVSSPAFHGRGQISFPRE